MLPVWSAVDAAGGEAQTLLRCGMTAEKRRVQLGFPTESQSESESSSSSSSSSASALSRSPSSGSASLPPAVEAQLLRWESGMLSVVEAEVERR